MDHIDINYYFAKQESNGRWYVYAVDVYGRSDRKVTPLQGCHSYEAALHELISAWEDIDCRVEGMNVYDYRGFVVASLELHAYRPVDEHMSTRPYPSSDYPNELLASKAGR